VLVVNLGVGGLSLLKDKIDTVIAIIGSLQSLWFGQRLRPLKNINSDDVDHQLPPKWMARNSRPTAELRSEAPASNSETM